MKPCCPLRPFCLFSLFWHKKIQTFSPKRHSLPQRSHAWSPYCHVLISDRCIKSERVLVTCCNSQLSLSRQGLDLLSRSTHFLFFPLLPENRDWKNLPWRVLGDHNKSLRILCLSHRVSTCHLPGMLLWKTDTRATGRPAFPEDSRSPLSRMSLIMFLHQAKHELPWRSAGRWRYGFSVIMWGLAPILYSINLSTSVAFKIDADRAL